MKRVDDELAETKAVNSQEERENRKQLSLHVSCRFNEPWQCRSIIETVQRTESPELRIQTARDRYTRLRLVSARPLANQIKRNLNFV